MGEKQRVLIVDDEPRNQRIVAETLEDLVDLKTANNGEEALAFMSAFLPDLVLLDIMMPGMDGYEVCRQIRANAEFKFVKVILVSGKAMVEERLRGYGAGADDYMTKPFVPEELMAKAKVFLKLARIEGELNEMNRELEQKVELRTNQLLDVKAKLASAAKMSALGEMAGGIAHEINTPLGAIALGADQIGFLMQADTISREQVAKMLGLISETVRRISIIIQGLRTFSRDGSNERFLDVRLTEIVESTLVLCGEKLKLKGIELRVDPIPDGLKCHCRAVQISQVLLNLINNSADAIANQSEKWIRLCATEAGGQIRISVTDSGPGIPASVKEKLFQPFFTTKEIGKGTGLGLSIAKGIAESHRGSLTLDELNNSTCFVLMLQASSADTVLGAA